MLAGVAAVAGLATGHATAAASKTLKVGLVADQGELNDHGFNQLAYEGLKRAEHDLGIKGRVVESASPAEYIPNMVALARQGYDLIIGVGFAQGDAIAATAKRFPDTHFAIVDVDHRDLKGKPKNVVGLLFKEQEVGYLVGYLGALSEKRRGGKAISAVGGFKQPPVDRYIAGYKAGAQKAVPGHQGDVGATRRTGTTRPSARSSRSRRSRTARVSSSRWPAAAASVRSTRRGRRACGGSASTQTSRSSARTC